MGVWRALLAATTIGIVSLTGARFRGLAAEAASTVPRTAWGDPDLQGIWTSDDMRGVPLERPDEFGTRRVLNREELARRVEQDQQTLRQQLRGPYGARNDLRTRTFGQTSFSGPPGSCAPGKSC